MLNWFRPSRNKNIFRYWDGTKTVGIDPIQAFRALDAHPEFDFESIGMRVEMGDMDAIDICCRAAQDVFHVRPWSMIDGKESGLSQHEILGLVARFLEYVVELKKNIALCPTSLLFTVPGTSPPSPTSNSSDSGSTSTAPNSDSPGPSTPEPLLSGTK